VFAGYYLVAPSTHDHFCVFEFLVPIGEEFAQANWDQFIDARRLDVPEPNEPISRWMVEASDIFGFARRDVWLSGLMLRVD